VLRVRGDGQHRYVSVDQEVLSLAGLHLSSATPAAAKKPRASRRKPTRK
jgi:hypothetical protein